MNKQSLYLPGLYLILIRFLEAVPISRWS